MKGYFEKQNIWNACGQLKLVFKGQAVTKKNSPRMSCALPAYNASECALLQRVGIDISKKKSRTYVLPSKAYENYEKDCLWQIPSAAKLYINEPVNVKCLFYMKTRGIVDKLNLEAAIHDILVAGGVLLDDDVSIVQSTDGTRVYYDHSNPRVEIIIERQQVDSFYKDYKKGKGKKKGIAS